MNYRRLVTTLCPITGPWPRAIADQAAAADVRDPLRLERRRGRRTPVAEAAGQIVATFRGEGLGLTRLTMVDISDGGMGVLSPVSMEVGTVVTLREARSGQPWADAVAVRCQARVDGQYRIGLSVCARRAA